MLSIALYLLTHAMLLSLHLIFRYFDSRHSSNTNSC